MTDVVSPAFPTISFQKLLYAPVELFPKLTVNGEQPAMLFAFDPFIVKLVTGGGSTRMVSIIVLGHPAGPNPVAETVNVTTYVPGVL